LVVAVEAPAPERLIKGGLPTEAMVAYVLVAKYAWHLQTYFIDVLTKLVNLWPASRLDLMPWARAVERSTINSPPDALNQRSLCKKSTYQSPGSRRPLTAYLRVPA
jgi:transposase